MGIRTPGHTEWVPRVSRRRPAARPGLRGTGRHGDAERRMPPSSTARHASSHWTSSSPRTRPLQRASRRRRRACRASRLRKLVVLYDDNHVHSRADAMAWSEDATTVRGVRLQHLASGGERLAASRRDQRSARDDGRAYRDDPIGSAARTNDSQKATDRPRSDGSADKEPTVETDGPSTSPMRRRRVDAQ